MNSLESATAPETYARWAAERDRAVLSPHGIASLTITRWLGPEPQQVPGVPGLWRSAGSTAVGDAAPGALPHRLAPGDELDVGALKVRAFTRERDIALRVFDPASPHRTRIGRIERYDVDPTMRVHGHYRPLPPESRRTTSVDGHQGVAVFDGLVELALGSGELSLVVREEPDGLFAAFADDTCSSGGYRFRMLRLPRPSEDGGVVIDLNLAYLTPSTLSPHYVCVLPATENRWPIAVRAGERGIRTQSAQT